MERKKECKFPLLFLYDLSKWECYFILQHREGMKLQDGWERWSELLELKTCRRSRPKKNLGLDWEMELSFAMSLIRFTLVLYQRCCQIGQTHHVVIYYNFLNFPFWQFAFFYVLNPNCFRWWRLRLIQLFFLMEQLYQHFSISRMWGTSL